MLYWIGITELERICIAHGILILRKISKCDPLLRENMMKHYSHPKGFVGRSLCYEVGYDGVVYGNIVGGSCTLHLPGRDEFFEIEKDDRHGKLLSIINNVFFHIEKVNGKYPIRNMAQKVLSEFCRVCSQDWKEKYGNNVLGFESLVELPRTGEIYRRNHWELVGTTLGYTCKRISDHGKEKTDSWGGQKVWDKTHLRPKLVFCLKYINENL